MSIASSDWAETSHLGGQFTDVKLLRTGTRFTIYEATEPAAHRSVVIKVPDETSASWLHDALDHEAAILAMIGTHPHIVTLYQRIVLPDGRPALLLERCTGSLDDSLHGDQRISLQRAAALGIKIAGALETAHNHGVLHCDVRPANVLVTEWGEPALAGFDESVSIDAGKIYAPRHVTTPHTAPELLEGNAPSPASDVYGLASTLYELVAGRAAFRAYAGESAATVIVRVLTNPVRPIVGPDVPLELSDLLTWAMSGDPAKRPPNPAWIAEELGRIEQREGWPRTKMILA
jgi:serine/threonine protein kinase